MCNGLMPMVFSGVMRMHTGCVRPARHLHFFPFILCGYGMCNGVMPMVCSGVMRTHEVCVRMPRKLQFPPLI